ncbi:hypothetical protein PCE1_000906 [Barthelona sp. PCE]
MPGLSSNLRAKRQSTFRTNIPQFKGSANDADLLSRLVGLCDDRKIREKQETACMTGEPEVEEPVSDGEEQAKESEEMFTFPQFKAAEPATEVSDSLYENPTKKRKLLFKVPEAKNKPSKADDRSVISLLSARTHHLEVLLKSRDVEIASLKLEIDELHRIKQNSDSVEVKRLQNQLVAMTQFLEDYGLVWLGGAEGARPSAVGPVPAAVQQFPVDFAKEFVSALRGISAVADEQVDATFVRDGKVTKLTTAEVPIVVFKNGFSVDRGMFRAFDSPSSLGFVQDIMEGYYPTEFKEKFPKGLGFEIHDSSDQSYEDYKSASTGVHTVHNAPRPLSPGALVAKLPTSKNGVSVRKDIEDSFGFAKNDSRAQLLQTIRLDDALDTNVATTKIRIKTDTGIIQIRLPITETVRALLNHVINHGHTGRRVFCPAKRADLELDATLQECELFPQAFVIVN